MSFQASRKPVIPAVSWFEVPFPTVGRLGDSSKDGLRRHENAVPRNGSIPQLPIQLLVLSATQMVDYVLKGHDFSRAANGVE